MHVQMVPGGHIHDDTHITHMPADVQQERVVLQVGAGAVKFQPKGVMVQYGVCYTCASHYT